MNAPSSATLDGSMRDLIREVVREVLRDELRERRNASPAMASEDRYLSVAKAADIAEVAPGTIRAWIRAGRLTGKHAGRELRVSRRELDQFMNAEVTGPNGVEAKKRAVHLFGHANPLRAGVA